MGWRWYSPSASRVQHRRVYQRNVFRHVAAAFGAARAYKIICVQRNNARVLPDALWVTTASQTWVVLPRCAGFALAAIVPSSAVPKWLDLSSMVVKPVAPGGRFARHPYPAQVSARVMTVPA